MRFIHTIYAVVCVLGIAWPVMAADAPVARAMVKVDPAAPVKVVYDIHASAIAAGTNKGLYYARGLIEAYGKQGVAPAQLASIWCCMAMRPPRCRSTRPTRRRSTIPSR